MRLSELLSALPGSLEPTGRVPERSDADPLIRGIAYDSRRVAAGDLFFALAGTEADGHQYLAGAAELGAVAAIVETAPGNFDHPHCPLIVVPDSRRAMAPIATRFFGHPSDELRLVGITGTNGKTSTSYLVESILRRSGTRTGLIGTVDIRYAGETERSVNTTPESYELQRMLRAMRTADVEAVVMEVSSHGLELGRVDGCAFAVAAFTNVTQDHLDFHGTMDAYRRSKIRLFDNYLAEDGVAVVNIDDANAAAFLNAVTRRGATPIRVSRHRDTGAEVALEDAQVRLDGTSARVRFPDGTIDLDIPLVGDFNVENTLVACGIGVALGIAPDAIAQGVSRCPQVPGRMERVASEPDMPTVIVDYAHTPDAIDKLLGTLQPLAGGRLISVFGCGGDRDRGKRPLMAEAVARFSDRIVATSDNPRSEDPQRILTDVEIGLSKLQRVDPSSLDGSNAAYCVVEDRRDAIGLAIEIARPGDMVVIAGKGHEDYQIIGPDRLPFDDRVQARRALQARSAR